MKSDDSDSDLPKELKIQQLIRGSLMKLYDICPYDILFVDQKRDSFSFLKISLWIEEDLDQIKEIIGYHNLCDKSGYIEFKETSTIILRGIALLSFFRSLNLAD